MHPDYCIDGRTIWPPVISDASFNPTCLWRIITSLPPPKSLGNASPHKVTLTWYHKVSGILKNVVLDASTVIWKRSKVGTGMVLS